MLFFSPCREHHPAWRASIRILLYFVYCALPLFFWPDRLWLAVWRCSTWKQTKSGIRSLSFSLNISTTTQNVELGSAFWGMFFVHTVRFNTHSFNSDIMLVWCLNHRFPLPKSYVPVFTWTDPELWKLPLTSWVAVSCDPWHRYQISNHFQHFKSLLSGHGCFSKTIQDLSFASHVTCLDLCPFEASIGSRTRSCRRRPALCSQHSLTH